MIADLIQGLYGKSINSLTDGGLGSRLVGGMAGTAGALRGVPGLGRMIPITPASPLNLFDYNQAKKLTDQPGMNSYFGGRSLHIGADRKHTLTEPDAGLGRSRLIGASILGGLATANLIGFDPMGITSMANSIGQVAGHAFIGSSLYQAGGKTRMLGMAYLGAMGINMMRAGDNYGPM